MSLKGATEIQESPLKGATLIDDKVSQNDQSLWETVKSGVKEAFTGEERIKALPEDVRGLPEFSNVLDRPPETLEDVSAIAKMLITLNPEAQKDIIESSIPGAKFERFNDTWVVTTPNGSRSIVNKPGLSGQDMASFMTEALAMFPAAKLASIPARISTRFLSGAAGGAATDIGLQAASKELGSKQPYDPKQTAIAGASLGAGEVVAPVARAVGRQFEKLSDRAAINKMVREGSTRDETAGYLLKGQVKNQPYVKQPDPAEIFAEITPALDDLSPRQSLPSTMQIEAPKIDDASFQQVPESEGLTSQVDEGMDIPVPPSGIMETVKELLPGKTRVVKAKSKKDLELQQVPMIVPNLLRTADAKTRSAMSRALDAHYDEVSGGKSRAYGVIGNEFKPYLSTIKRETEKAIKKQQSAINDLSKVSGIDIADAKQKAVSDFSDVLNMFGITIKDGKLDYSNVSRESAYIAQPKAKGQIQKIYNQLVKASDARDLHFAKKDAQDIIYQQKALGKPLAKDVRGLIDSYQKGINRSLREISPEYAQANDVLSKNQEVITDLKNAFNLDDNALDNLDDAKDLLPDMGDDAVKTLNQLGLQLRTLDTNYKKGPEVEAAINKMAELAGSYGYKGGADLASIAKFLNGVKASHIGDKLGTMRGIEDSAAKKGAALTQEGIKQRAVDTFNAIDKAGQESIGIGKQGTYKAIKSYIKEVDKSQKAIKKEVDPYYEYRKGQGGYMENK